MVIFSAVVDSMSMNNTWSKKKSNRFPTMTANSTRPNDSSLIVRVSIWHISGLFFSHESLRPHFIFVVHINEQSVHEKIAR